jgi:trimethylamine--corrinoid protein Co-methyltransferase
MIQLTVLTVQDIEAIHQATLRILDETGVVLTLPEAREILTGAGATVRGERVRLPPELVEREVAHCPRQVIVRGRSGETRALGDGNLYWHNVGGARDVYDPRTGQRRPATLQDVRDSARLLDALEGVTTITPFFTPQDVPGPLMSLAMYRHTLPHTTRPVQGPGVQTATEVRYLARMAAVIAPSVREALVLGISPVSPLTFPDDIAEAMIETARQGMPLGPLPCPIAGATAPMSLAGALAQQNAEMLASVVLAQLVHPGLPMVYCGRLSFMDPRSGVAVWGATELGLASAATVQIAHYYGLPANVYGLATNAHVMDSQGGYERALNAVIPALAGADELSGIGMQAAAVAGSYAQMVCDNEIAASVRRLRQGLVPERGLVTDPDALAVDVIAAAMDGSRNFLGQRHTVRYLRAGEMWLPRLADWCNWDEWDRAGRRDTIVRAQAEAKRLLTEHQVPPLTAEQERGLEEIMEQAARCEAL